MTTARTLQSFWLTMLIGWVPIVLGTVVAAATVLGEPDKLAQHAMLLVTCLLPSIPLCLIHHTDRRVLYNSGNYRRLMAAHGPLPCMSRHGDCYDNACAESFFPTLKNELTHGQAFATRDTARIAIVSYIEGFYNRKRLHQTLGYRTPTVVDDEAMSS